MHRSTYKYLHYSVCTSAYAHIFTSSYSFSYMSSYEFWIILPSGQQTRRSKRPKCHTRPSEAKHAAHRLQTSKKLAKHHRRLGHFPASAQRDPRCSLESGENHGKSDLRGGSQASQVTVLAFNPHSLPATCPSPKLDHLLRSQNRTSKESTKLSPPSPSLSLSLYLPLSLSPSPSWKFC